MIKNLFNLFVKSVFQLFRSLSYEFQHSRVAFGPAYSNTLGTSGGGTSMRVSDTWLLKFYFME